MGSCHKVWQLTRSKMCFFFTPHILMTMSQVLTHRWLSLSCSLSSYNKPSLTSWQLVPWLRLHWVGNSFQSCSHVMSCNLQYVGYTIIWTKVATTGFEGCMVVGYGQCWAGIRNDLRTNQENHWIVAIKLHWGED